MQPFEILYYDGRTSVSHQASLSLERDYWVITYGPEFELQTLHWEITQVERDMGFTSLFIFRYGGFPQQTLECKDENLLTELKRLYPEKAFFEKPINVLLRGNTTALVSLTMGLIGILLISYFYILPWFSEKVAGQIPVSTEISLGETLFGNTITHYKKNDTLTARVNDFVKEIDFKTNYPIKVTVVDQDEMNAFALPGGNIIVFDKLLGKMKSADELAALLAHEVSHVHYRHSLKNIFRSLSGYLLISLLFNDINGITAILADNSNMLLNLNYSRNLETEADQKAVEILKANGLNLNGLVGLFTLLQEENNSVATIKLLSTHPLTTERIDFAKEVVSRQNSPVKNESLERKWRAIATEKTK
jgi:predicted Zn-dependent protease